MKKSKKKIFLFLLASIIFLIASFGSAYAATNITIYLDGQQLKPPVDPMVKDSRVLVPLRLISESLGATVNYYSADKKIEILLDGDEIILYVNKKDVWVNSEKDTLDVPATVINNYTLVPIRFVSENLNVKVDWDNTLKRVNLTRIKQLILASLTEEERFFQNELLGYINDARSEIGLEELVLFDKLTTIARLHAKDMALNNFFSHNSPTYGNPNNRANDQGMDNISEVIAFGYPDARSVFDAWMDSSTHRAIILDADARFIGIGKYQLNSGNDSIYMVCDLFSGDGVIISDRKTKISGNTLAIDVYLLKAQPLIIYRLDPADSSRYLDRKTIELDPDDDNWLHLEIEFWDQGTFMINLSSDVLTVNNS